MSDRVRLRIPIDATNLITPSGDQVVVKIDEAGRYADVIQDDARQILFNGLPASVPWREANPLLIETLKPPPRVNAVRVVDLQHAADMARPINPFDRAAIARQTLAMLRGDR
jgi:hypothetical protein